MNEEIYKKKTLGFITILVTIMWSVILLYFILIEKDSLADYAIIFVCLGNVVISAMSVYSILGKRSYLIITDHSIEWRAKSAISRILLLEKIESVSMKRRWLRKVICIKTITMPVYIYNSHQKSIVDIKQIIDDSIDNTIKIAFE